MNKLVMIMSSLFLLSGASAHDNPNSLSNPRARAVLKVFLSNMGQMKISNPGELDNFPVKGKTVAEIFANASLTKSYPGIPNSYPATQYEIGCSDAEKKGDPIECWIATYTETYQVNSHDLNEAKKVYQGDGNSADGVIPVIYTFKVLENYFRGNKAFKLFSNAVAITTAG